VTRSILLRAVAGAVAALAIAAPAASASEDGPSVPVCNQASLYFQGGGLVALDPATDSPAARYTDDLTELPGNGEGLVTAAGHSPALTVCGDDAPPPPFDVGHRAAGPAWQHAGPAANVTRAPRASAAAATRGRCPSRTSPPASCRSAR
jgi:hypothetical protein